LLMKLRNPELGARVADVAGKLREAEAQLRMLTLQRVSQSFASEQQERDSLQTASRVEARAKGLRNNSRCCSRKRKSWKSRRPSLVK